MPLKVKLFHTELDDSTSSTLQLSTSKFEDEINDWLKTPEGLEASLRLNNIVQSQSGRYGSHITISLFYQK
jgi:hypothetical protein